MHQPPAATSITTTSALLLPDAECIRNPFYQPLPGQARKGQKPLAPAPRSRPRITHRQQASEPPPRPHPSGPRASRRRTHPVAPTPWRPPRRAAAREGRAVGEPARRPRARARHLAAARRAPGRGGPGEWAAAAEAAGAGGAAVLSSLGGGGGAGGGIGGEVAGLRGGPGAKCRDCGEGAGRSCACPGPPFPYSSGRVGMGGPSDIYRVHVSYIYHIYIHDVPIDR